VRLRTRFVLLIALAALGPLALLGGVAIRVSTTRVVAKVAEVQARTADALADHVGSWLDVQIGLVARQVATFDLASLRDQERAGFLRLVYQQNPGVQIVSLVDDLGQERAPSVYLGPTDTSGAKGRDLIDQERFRAFRQDLDQVRRQTPPGRVGVGEPRVPQGRSAPVLVLAARLAGGVTLGVELDLGPLAPHFSVAEGSTEELSLLAADGAVVLGKDDLVDRAVMASLPPGTPMDDIRYQTSAGLKVLAASAPVPGTGWRVVVSEPMSTTQAAARAITERTGFVMGVAALLAVLLGLVVARQVTGPVLSLRDAALAVAEGEFGRRVDGVEGGGELTELTHAFNFMSRRLQQDRDVIAAKNAQIEAFNAELQQRVEERTEQLRQAQEHLIRSARLAAVGEMGAGLAHELNNPLAGILGLSQVLAARSSGPGEAAMVASIEEQARRCAEIVSRIQRFSRLEADAAPLDREGWGVVDLAEAIEEALALVRGSFGDRGVDLARELEPDLLVRGDRGALVQALVQLLNSLRSAAAPGARLHLYAHSADNQVIVDLLLGGAPLRVGNDDWMASGMGFWAARQVLAAHGGLLEEPTLPAGTEATEATEGRWRLRLPRS